MSTLAPVPATRPEKEHGLAFWMNRVMEECDHAGLDLAADPVHDLRVALRRCRSMSDGLMTIDPDPSWKQMKKAGKRLFSSLGELRDVQVMQEWIQKLGNPDDSETRALLELLSNRELQHKQQAGQALREFDRKQWKKWSSSLPRRATKVRTGSLVFRHLALERWTEARRLQSVALRNRSQASWHNLRIGLKRFRYIVENFLPQQHEAWSRDLKELQDLLGEVHDLDVLWAAAVQVNAFPDLDSRRRWHDRILEERNRRIQAYRDKMVGKNSLWSVWRADLPSGDQIEEAAFRRLQLWGSFLDPDPKHSSHVADLALQIYDALPEKKPDEATVKQRKILRLAALLHEVGLSRRKRGHQKVARRLVSKLQPPLGWSATSLHLVGVVARYHRGALPRAGQKSLRGLSALQRQSAVKLAAVLRLANAFDEDHTGRIKHIEFQQKNGYLSIAAEGYHSRDRMAESIAAGRHLLETVYHRPILVKPFRQPKLAS